jgi:cardiolipin synthase A/B
MKIELCVGAAEFWKRLQIDVAQARKRVHVQTLSCEGDSVGKGLARALLASSAPDRRIAVDSFTRWMVNDKFLYCPKSLLDRELQSEVRATAGMMAELIAGGVAVQWINPVDPLLLRLSARNHKKMVLVDDHVAYFGGINFSEHNFAWHDMMFRIEDPGITAFLSSDFHSTWAGQDIFAARDFGGIAFQLLDGRSNESAYAVALSLIQNARQSILVESPYLTFPFSDAIRAAAGRGVKVQLITSAENNWKLVDEYLIWESARSGMELWRLPRMTHLKAMLVDDETLVVGSSNFDYLSYRLLQELVAVVTDPRTVAEFKERILIPDLAASTRCTRNVSHLRGWLRRAELRFYGDFSAATWSLHSASRALLAPRTSF